MSKLPTVVTKEVLKQIERDVVKRRAKSLFGSQASPALVAYVDSATEHFLDWPYDNVPHPKYEVNAAYIAKKYPSTFPKNPERLYQTDIVKKIINLGVNPEENRMKYMIEIEKRKQWNFQLQHEGKFAPEYQWYAKFHKNNLIIFVILGLIAVPVLISFGFDKTEFYAATVKGSFLDTKDPPFSGVRPWDKMVKNAEGQWVLKK